MTNSMKPVLLLTIGILAVILFLQTTNFITGMDIGTPQATIPTYISSQNVAPDVRNVNFTMAANAQACANDTNQVWCEGIVNDSNGWNNVTKVNASLWHTDVASGASCAANRSNCYVNSTCNLNTSIDATRGWWNCSFNKLTFYAENGTWNCTMWATDGAYTASNNTILSGGTATRARNAYLALNVNSSINWGTVVLGVKNQQGLWVQNCGNRAIDLNVNASDFACPISGGGTTLKTSGNMTVGNTTAADNLMTMDTTLRQLHTNHLRPVHDNETINYTTWWNMTVPLSAGISGTCQGNASIVAIENT